jgi:hypothetical protein
MIHPENPHGATREVYDTDFAIAHIDIFVANMKRSGIRLSSVPLKINAPEPDQWAYLPPFAPSRIC